MSRLENDIRAREPDRQKMQAKLDAFLAKGGQIERPGTPSPIKPLSMRDYGDITWARRNEQ
ncbi:hypothetical protein H9654_00570 [Stenotrophomonas sp. Sa5BUN4]|uniref:Uncharacterized protein n=1 Tax=Stenotrophomonas lacuserhaii TaxID=2760084 RepID=A0A8X8FS03_9GAMM|nr:hypothetical protein [Stenotrophomonas pennii]MBD7952686.1 hypothetical protein [Stenotrophomonas pennii]